MRVKFNRGPMKNKRTEVSDDSAVEYRVREPIFRGFDRLNERSKDHYESRVQFEYRDGSYRRSNVRLKDGTVVFEWMGWYE
jgi:hypothetical protein